MKTKFIIIMLLISGISLETMAQKKPKKQDWSDAIEDNSFFIEEAYNQENRIVQHIFNGYLLSQGNNDFLLSFTQEWPAFGLKHQLSYTLPYSFLNGDSLHGFGDLMINYRYQASYKESKFCFSPRLSVILPTANKDKGLGSGSWGLQLNLPLSKRVSNQWIIHANAGTTALLGYESKGDSNQTFTNTLHSFNIGVSLIWLIHERFNLMLEYLDVFNPDINSENKTIYTTETIISPGLRFAIPVNNLEIVPGISLPVSVTARDTRVNGFFYLSLEHPF